MDNFVTLDKINTLVADLLTTEAWKEFVFPELLKSNDKLSQIYIDRCETMKQRNPKDWDGIWVMDTK